MANDYPRDGESYATSAKKQTRKPTSPISNKFGIQKDMIEWLQQGIDFAGNLDNIQVDKFADGVDRQVSIEAQVLAHKTLRDLLISKKIEFEEYIKEN